MFREQTTWAFDVSIVKEEYRSYANDEQSYEAHREAESA